MYQPDKIEKTEAEVVANPFTLEAVIAWLKTKNPSETYNWMGNCLWTQYGVHLGLGRSGSDFSSYGEAVRGFSGVKGSEPFNRIPREGGGIMGVAISEPRTFGGALARAEEALRLGVPAYWENSNEG